jgi:hypothetical protein
MMPTSNFTGPSREQSQTVRVVSSRQAKSPTEKKSALIFSEIGSLATALDRMGVLLIGEPDDQRDAQAFHTVVKALAGQVGLLCDIGEKLNGGEAWREADPVAWLLPPAYVETSQGEQA